MSVTPTQSKSKKNQSKKRAVKEVDKELQDQKKLKVEQEAN